MWFKLAVMTTVCTSSWVVCLALRRRFPVRWAVTYSGLLLVGSAIAGVAAYGMPPSSAIVMGGAALGIAVVVIDLWLVRRKSVHPPTGSSH